jgi:hypothetical protein
MQHLVPGAGLEPAQTFLSIPIYRDVSTNFTTCGFLSLKIGLYNKTSDTTVNFTPTSSTRGGT